MASAGAGLVGAASDGLGDDEGRGGGCWEPDHDVGDAAAFQSGAEFQNSIVMNVLFGSGW